MKKLYLVMSQSEDVEHSSAYCFATTMGARHTFGPPAADTSHTRPLSQSASRRHNSPILRPYAKRQLPKAVKKLKIYHVFKPVTF